MQIDRDIDKGIDRQKASFTTIQTCDRYRLMYRKIDRLLDINIYGQTYRNIHRQIDNQIDR